MRSVIERKTFVCTRKFVKFVQFVVYNISVVLDLVECKLLDWWTKTPYDHYNEWLSETYDALKKAGRE